MTARSHRRTTLTCALLLAALVALTGCGGDSNAGTPTNSVGFGIVVGARSNSPVPDWDVIDQYVPADLPPGSRIVAVGVDGNPHGYGLFEETVQAFEFSGDAADADQRLRAALKKAVTSAAAPEPEADVLGAIAAVARSIHGVGTSGTIFVSDSTLSTAGPITMQDGVLDLAPEDLAEQLAGNQELPDLTGLSLIIAGQGNTTPPQQPLTEQHRRKLRVMWEHIFLTAGATSVRYHDLAVTDPTPPGLPPVTPVTFGPSPRVPATPSSASEPTSAPNHDPAPACHIMLADQQVTFLPDSAEFLDPTMALTVIEEQAAAIRSCPGRVRVIGTTSSFGTPEGRAATSSERAAAVADALAGILGVDRAAIETVGAGIDNPWHANDRGPDGALIPEIAVHNRSVHIEVVPAQ